MTCNYLKLYSILVAFALVLAIFGCEDDTTSMQPITDATIQSDADVDAEVDAETETDDSDAMPSEQDDAGKAEQNEDKGQFGQSCEENEDCESQICHTFGQVGDLCTVECEEDEECPEGENGESKCNKQNVCRP